MSTKQPNWKYISNLGDASPRDYGGKFLYIDRNNEYDPELEVLEPPCDDSPKGPYEIYRFSLDKYKLIEKDGHTFLVPDHYEENWPHPISHYQPWFIKYIHSYADQLGIPDEDMRAQFCSDDPTIRAFAYIEIGQYHGFHELDNYPLQLASNELGKRYRRKELC